MKHKNLSCNIPKRYVLVMMVFVGYVNFFYLHTNIAMAIVDMTSNKSVTHENVTVLKYAEYTWNSKQKAIVLGSFSYGRLLGPIGGVLASQYGGSTLYGIGTLISALITILTPFFLYTDFYLFVFATGLTGTFESFAYASVSQLWSRWAPPHERAKFISISLIGMYAGPIVSYLVAGWILTSWTWSTLFYVSGIASFIWYWIWWLVVRDDPSIDKHISDGERLYIKNKLGLNNVDYNQKIVYPWKQILTCKPFWAGCICKFCNGCGFTFSMMYLPQYIKDTNDIDIKKIGYISLIPMLCSVISMPMVGFLLDYIRSNKVLTLTQSHKTFVSISLFIGTACFILAGVWPNFLLCMACLSIYQFFSTFALLDILVLVLDLAPRYAAFMNAVANACSTMGGFLTPIFVGFVVTSHSQSQWSTCFITCSLIFSTSAFVFLKFGSGDLQPWANYKAESRHEDSIAEQDPPPPRTPDIPA